MGAYIYFSNSNRFVNYSTSSNIYGTYEYNSLNNIFDNFTSTDNNYGFYQSIASMTNLTNSKITGSSTTCLYLSNAGQNGANNYYNNLFNCSKLTTYVNTIYKNNWNISPQAGDRIYTTGNIGGNFWAQPNGKGFSQLCTDSNCDGFCDSNYNVTTNSSCDPSNCGNNADFYAYSEGDNVISECQEITSSGTYCMAGDIEDQNTPDCINISADNVILNCNGNMIDGINNVDGYKGVNAFRASTYSANISISNCVISDWYYYGLSFSRTFNVTLDNISSESNSVNGARLYLSDNSMVTNSKFDNNGQNGLYYYWTDNVYTENNTMRNNTRRDFFTLGNEDDCAHFWSNNTGTDDKPIIYHTQLDGRRFIVSMAKSEVVQF
jgi:hypothetical protein